MKKLNLGCGFFKKEGFVNLDFSKDVNPDVVHDLNKFPYPFKDNEFDLIEADHVLEHLNEPFSVMKELRRITKQNGTIIIRVPHATRGFTNPDHIKSFDVSFPLYFNKNLKHFYHGFTLKLERMRLRWLGQTYLKKIVLPQYQYYPARILGKFIDFFANISPYLC